MYSCIAVPLILALKALYFIPAHGGQLSEADRVEYFHSHHSWPPTWHDESPKHREMESFRESEIMQLTGGAERWENWMQFVQGMLGRKFTDRGFEVVDIPVNIFHKINNSLHEGIRELGGWDNVPAEFESDGMYGPEPPKFVPLQVAREVLAEMKEFHEGWVNGMELVPTSAYGIRLYTNGSTLVMHYDKVFPFVLPFHSRF